MADDINPLEILKQEISELQKQFSIKREMLNREMVNDNEKLISIIQKEINDLKDRILMSQAELRKLYLKQSNTKIETLKQKSINKEFLNSQ